MINFLAEEVNENMKVFGLVHIMYIVIGLAIVIPLAIYVSKKRGWDKKVFLVAAILLGLGESIRTLGLVELGSNGGYYLSPQYIPLHLCAIQIFFIIGILLSKSNKAIRFWCAIMYPTLVAGAAMALLIPSPEGTDTFLSFRGFQFFASHLVLMFVGIYMYLTKPVKFGWGTFGMVVLFMCVSLIGAIYINAILGGASTNVNFWFLAYPPQEGLPLLNMDNGWGMYVFNLGWVTMLLLGITYIPVIVRYYRDKKAGLLDENIEFKEVSF